MKLNRTLGSFPNRIPRLRIACVAMAVLMAVVASLMHASPAKAADGDDVYDHFVYWGISNPANTTVDLFDYWITNQGDNDRTSSATPTGGTTTAQLEATGFYYNGQWWGNNPTVVNRGINQNHTLLFHGGAGGAHPEIYASESFTGMSGDTPPSAYWGTVIQGLVQSNLGADGYPVLNDNRQYTNDDPLVLVSQGNDASYPDWNHPNVYRFMERNGYQPNESLAYLFDPDVSTAGKASYPDVNGLFSVDDYGYYIYNSGYQTAHLNRDSSRFELGQQPVDGQGNRANGFWPLDDITAPSGAVHNDYMGMHMNMDFSQPNNGMVLNPQGEYVPMTFTFTGDDDVWLFIDGVLIGDVGGIHQPSSLQVDFKTGIVKVNENPPFDDSYIPSQGGEGPTSVHVAQTTIRALFLAAKGEAWMAEHASDFDGDTFAAGTYHDIDFFYLERGNNESNLEIRFNMISTADFTAHKALIAEPAEILGHDRFQFELIGLNGRYHYDPDTQEVSLVDPDVPALTPIDARNYTTEGATPAPGDVSRYWHEEGDRWVYRVGAAADGNVNFGNADFSGTALNDVYRYMIRETGTPGSEYEADERIYYMEATVAWDDQRNEWYLRKRYYTDETYTTPATDTNFVSFVNLRGDVTKATPVIPVAKDLKQGDQYLHIEEGQFSFEAVDSTGRVVARCDASDEYGVAHAELVLPTITPVDFNGITPGDIVRTYTVREVIPTTDDGIAYDSNEHTVEVRAHYENGDITFQTFLDGVLWSETGNPPSDDTSIFFHNAPKPVSVSITKVWDDSAAGADTRLAHPVVKFRVYADGEAGTEEIDGVSYPLPAKDSDGQPVDDKTVPEDPEGDDGEEARTLTWENLPKYDSNGNEITYKVIEIGNADGYVKGEPKRVGDTGFVYQATNTLKDLSLNIKKVVERDGDDPDAPEVLLPGAGFTLTMVDSETLEPIAEPGEEQRTGEDGIASFTPIQPGTYRISETTVPDGYQKAADIYITINPDGSGEISDGGESSTPTPLGPGNFDADTRTVSIEITNTELPALPATGGPGDLFLIVSGVALIVAAMTLLDWSGRRESQ